MCVVFAHLLKAVEYQSQVLHYFVILQDILISVYNIVVQLTLYIYHIVSTCTSTGLFKGRNEQ